MKIYLRFGLLCVLAAFCSVPYLAAETWFVRPDGGTRYSAKATEGQCDGRSDAAYPGKGVNRHCAFSDYRFLWDDQHDRGVFKWVIAGGDTVVLRKNIRNGKDAGWRVGFSQGNSPNDPWCYGGNGIYSCTNPVIPAGTASQHTRILGENYEHCADRSAETQIFGGFAVDTAMNLAGAQFVDVQCIEITDHSDCVTHGESLQPRYCEHNHYPMSDFDSNGITTDSSTHDILLRQMWIHGHTNRGILGPIGGLVTADHVDIDKNGMAGWDFDNGSGFPSTTAELRLIDSVVEWSGCNEEYPIVHATPVTFCYGQSNGGYGDGIGTPAHMGMNVIIERSTFRYNTQDGEDFGHIDTGSHKLRITNSTSYGNGGAQFKWGANFTSVVFENNLAIANCKRMSAPFPGAPATYNSHLGDFCRAHDAVSFNFRQGGQVLFANNTIVTYAPTTFDIDCWDESCSDSRFLFENNLVLGYDNPGTYNMGGQPGGVGGFYYGHPIGKITRLNDLYHGLRNAPCDGKDICLDPGLVSEPRFTQESDLDNFNAHPSSLSAARHRGVRVGDIPIDIEGHPRPTAGNFTIGAFE